MTDEKDLSRLRLMVLPRNWVIDLLKNRTPVSGEFKAGAGHEVEFHIPMSFDLPVDTEVVDMDWDIRRNGLVLRLWSSKFEPVEDGCIIPDIHVLLTNRVVHMRVSKRQFLEWFPSSEGDR